MDTTEAVVAVAADVNGGNAESDPNLEKLDTVENLKTSDSIESSGDKVAVKEEGDSEVNGELKNTTTKLITGKRKMRKSDANNSNASNIEDSPKPKTRGQKRKLSEREDVSSEESTEFNGFAIQSTENEESGSHVLKKLIGNYNQSSIFI